MLLELTCCRTYLSEELARRARAHPRYSQRAFARDLGMSPGELSEVLQDKRRLSLRSALKVAKALSLNPTETKHLLYLVQMQATGIVDHSIDVGGWKPIAEDPAASRDRFRLVSDWICFALLNLAECSNFRGREEWMARRLGVSRQEIRVALGRLERIGLVSKERGRWIFPAADVAAPEGVPSEAVRNYHRQILERATRALEIQPVDQREFAGVGFAVDPRQVASLKKDIANFLDECVAKYARGKHRTEVYHMEMALFRMTEGEGDGQ